MGGVLDWIGLPTLAKTSDLVNPAKWLTDWALGGGRRVAAGVPVTPESAMNLSAYFGGIRIVSEDLGKLPWGVELATGAEDGMPTVRDARDHQADRLLRLAPNREMGSQQWRELMIAWALGWGNGRSEIQRDGLGNPIALWPIHPSLIRPWRDPETWELFYYVRPFGTFEGGLIPLEDVFDVHGVGPDGINGYSLAQLGRQDVSTGLAAAEFEGAMYSGGAVSRGVLKYPKKLDDAQLRRLRKQWRQTYGNGSGADGLSSPVILEGGMEFQAVSINPRDAQMLEGSRENVVTIARWFRLPPHKLAALDRATFSNIEHLSLEYVQDTLLAWATRLEGEANRKLFRPSEVAAGYRTAIDLEALLRGDHKTLTEGLRTQVSTGVLTPNEARAKLRRNPSTQKGADKLWLQGAMRTLESLTAAPAPAAGPSGASGSGPSDPSGEPPADPAAEPATHDPAEPADPATPAAAPAAAPVAGRWAAPLRRQQGRRQALLDAAARASVAVGPALADATLRLARRQQKALERTERAGGAERELRAAVAEWAAGERGPAIELLVPAVATFVTVAGMATDRWLAGPVPSVDVPAVVGAFVDAHLAAQPEAALARRKAGRTFDVAAAAGELSAGILAALEAVIVPRE